MEGRSIAPKKNAQDRGRRKKKNGRTRERLKKVEE
jgi:hypothetical protein